MSRSSIALLDVLPNGEFPILETRRLQLRQLVASDAEALFAISSDERVLRFIAKAAPKSVDEIRTKIDLIAANFHSGDGIMWAAMDRSSQRFVGTAGIWRLEREHFRGEIGYQIAPEFWGQGLIPEALAAIVQWGFQRLELHSLEAKIHPDNRASERVLQKLGFVKEAHLRQNYYNRVASRFEDTVVYSLIER